MRWPWGRGREWGTGGRCSFEALLLSTRSCAQRESSLKAHDAIWLISVKVGRSGAVVEAEWLRMITAERRSRVRARLLLSSPASPRHIISSGSPERLLIPSCCCRVLTFTSDPLTGGGAVRKLHVVPTQWGVLWIIMWPWLRQRGRYCLNPGQLLATRNKMTFSKATVDRRALQNLSRPHVWIQESNSPKV